MSNTVNKIEAKLVLTSESSKAVSELQKVANQAKEVSKAAQDAQRKMGQMKGPSVPNMPSTVLDSAGNRHSYEAYAAAQKRLANEKRKAEEQKAYEAINPTASKGPSADAIMAFAAKGAVALSAISGLTRGLETLADTSKGTGSKVQALIGTIPIVGDAAVGLSKAFVELMNSTSRKDLKLSELGNATIDAKGQNRFGQEQKLNAARMELSGGAMMANSMRPDSFLMPVDGEDERVTQAKYNERRAKRAADLATQDADSFGRINEIGRRDEARRGTRVREANVGVDVNLADATAKAEAANQIRNAESRADRASKSTIGQIALTNPIAASMAYKSPLEGLAQLEDAQQSRKDLGRALITQEEALRTAKEKQVAEARALAEYEKARTETMKAQAAVLKDQLASAKAAEKSFGMMSANDKENVLAAMKNAKEKGFENITEEERSLLAGNSATSKFAEKEAERIGGSDSKLAELRALTGDKSSSDLSKELKDLSAKIDVKIDIDEAALADKFKSIMDMFISKLEVIVKRQTDNSADQIDSSAAKQRSLQLASS